MNRIYIGEGVPRNNLSCGRKENGVWIQILHLELICQHNLTTAVYVFHYLLLKPTNLLSKFNNDGSQFAIIILKDFDFILQSGNAFQLPPSAFGSCDPVPLSFAFQFYPLLIFHVDGRHWRRAAQRRTASWLLLYRNLYIFKR